jgi:hypothetical protein
MGDRYFLEVSCPECDTFDDDVYFAPTCGFTDWVCPGCKYVVDLHEYTGISYEDASNAGLISDLLEELTKKHESEEE